MQDRIIAFFCDFHNAADDLRPASDEARQNRKLLLQENLLDVRFELVARGYAIPEARELEFAFHLAVDVLSQSDQSRDLAFVEGVLAENFPLEHAEKRHLLFLVQAVGRFLLGIGNSLP